MFQSLPRAAVLSIMMAACALAHGEEAGVTPYRPSVSTPAQLPTPGQLEFEAGWLSARADGARRDSVPVLFKLAFSEQWGVTVGAESYVDLRQGDQSHLRGLGDTVVTLKRAFIVDEKTAFGLELGAKLPSARSDIGSGKADATVNGIFSRDIGAVHMDANLNLTRLGAHDADTGSTLVGVADSFSSAIDEHWGALAELSATRQGGAPWATQLLLGLTYSPSKQMTVDFGLIHGLSDSATHLGLFGGVVLPLAKLW
ncbi:MAG: transporter [Pseudomonadota bacterium]